MPDTSAAPSFGFDNTFAALDGFFVPWQAAEAPSPRLMAFNRPLAGELGLDPEALSDDLAAAVFSGNLAPADATPLAQAYAGHQFGGFSPQLGDGRALLLGEIVDRAGQRRDVQLKGSGRTPFSRGGDGKAAVGPVLREYLIGEAMHALGVPTTRALAAVTTGELVYRETALPGAVLTRVASSHIRVGTFQFFAARGETEKTQALADYAVQRHYPEAAKAENPYLALFQAVVEAQARLIAKWMSIGFIHGVMNTDNMTISGETIDYGPCAFMDAYDPNTVFSSIDTGGRYAYGNQPPIAQWNLTRFAETLIPLVNDDQDAAIETLTAEVKTFRERYLTHWLAEMRAKLGLATAEAEDFELAVDLFQAMADGKADFTNTFRHLAPAASGKEGAFLAEFTGGEAAPWLARWRKRLEREEGDVAARLAAANPVYIPRNHKVEEALDAAVAAEDLGPFERLLDVLTQPFGERDGLEAYTAPAPTGGPRYQTFCGT